jgi:hypothetical protein
MEYLATTKLPLQTLTVSPNFCRYSTNSQWYDLHSYLFHHLGEGIRPQRGRKLQKGLQRSPFLAINAKGGENIKPKAKGPHHHFKKIRNKVLIGISSNGICFN